jgi:mRNA-degrading endonuclease YafQ of YafQ-DinJ toxin-antitoxin module
VTYRFKATPTFWRAFHRLSPAQQHKAKEVFEVFQANPFHPSLKTHKIHHLSAYYGRTIYSVTVEANLRAVFFREGDVIYTVDIGSHDLYK